MPLVAREEVLHPQISLQVASPRATASPCCPDPLLRTDTVCEGVSLSPIAPSPLLSQPHARSAAGVLALRCLLGSRQGTQRAVPQTDQVLFRGCLFGFMSLYAWMQEAEAFLWVRMLLEGKRA